MISFFFYKYENDIYEKVLIRFMLKKNCILLQKHYYYNLNISLSSL